VLWTDDDVLVEPDWLTTFAAIVARHPTAAAIGGQVEPWFPIDPDPDLLAVFAPLRNGYCGVNFGPDERLVAEHEMFVGALMAYRQDAVRGLQFDPNLGRNGNFLGGGEDYRYQVQVNERGGERIWAPSLRLRHYVDPSRMTLDYARKYYFDLRHGAIHDDDRAPRLAGVPRWLFKQYGWAVVRQWGNRLLGRRRAHLQGLVDTWKYANLIRSYRAQV
jgi:GT2 family glycosyltransferase